MKFEVLKRSHLKRNIIIGVIVVGIISTIVLNFTKAKYRTTQSIPLVNGTINYSLADFNSVAIYIQSDNEYRQTDTIPDSGYVLNEEKSYCKINNEKAENISLSYDTNTKTLSISPITTKGTKCYLYFDEFNINSLADVCAKGTNLAECIKKYHDLIDFGHDGLYLHDSNLENSANDGSYRYSGSNPNNYVCFGSNEETCPEENLYRIIGVFDNQIKLIKYTQYGSYFWSGAGDNTSHDWSQSSLNTEILNNEYLKTFNNSWQNMIATTNWKIGEITENLGNAKQFYDVEVGSLSSNITYSAKIGLMYVSDYGFASEPTGWTISLTNYSSLSAIWLAEDIDIYNLGTHQWTISVPDYPPPFAFCIIMSGDRSGDMTSIEVTHIGSNYGDLVYPTFYLIDSVKYLSGTGSINNPIKIE